MPENPDSAADIKDTDIVFDCPHCGKSLVIDYRGAGLTIQCSDCGSDVVVPIPEGMELTDIDSTGEEQEMRILNLRRSLAAAEQRVIELEAEVQSLRAALAGAAAPGVPDRFEGLRGILQAALLELERIAPLASGQAPDAGVGPESPDSPDS